MSQYQIPDEDKTIKVKRKYIKRAKAIPESELDANDVQIVVVASLLEELEDGNILFWFILEFTKKCLSFMLFEIFLVDF